MVQLVREVGLQHLDLDVRRFLVRVAAVQQAVQVLVQFLRLPRHQHGCPILAVVEALQSQVRVVAPHVLQVLLIPHDLEVPVVRVHPHHKSELRALRLAVQLQLDLLPDRLRQVPAVGVVDGEVGLDMLGVCGFEESGLELSDEDGLEGY